MSRRRLGAAALLLIGSAAGVLAWGGFHTAMEASNSTAFCTSCHEMRDNVFVEYKKSAHYRNASGVRAECADCHVPRAWGPKVLRKVRATRDLYYHLLGSIDTPDKFAARRAVLAERVWAEMKANDSRECRNCHSWDAMDPHQQTERARTKKPKAQAEGQTCIECHQGVAHQLPPRDD